MIRPIKKRKMDILLMPCIKFTENVLGALGSFFFKNKYCAIWFQTPIKIVLVISITNETLFC
jgi:hypothetical protein